MTRRLAVLPPRVRAGLALLLVCGAAAAAPTATDASPRWNELTPVQQQALAPLQRDWSSIDPQRRGKWIEVASRFPTMSTEERGRVQQRMTEWARMTPAERAQARLQFQFVRNLPAEERQARWQAYQALSDDEKRKLALEAKPAARAGSASDGAASRPRSGGEGSAKRNLVVPTPPTPGPTIAPTVVQARPGATTTTMSTRAAPPLHHQAGLPKIAATPGFVDPATLLPKRGPQGAAAARPAPSSPSADAHTPP